MPNFNLKGLSNYTQAESLLDETNLELAKQKQTFLRNSDRSFAWEQVAKYSGVFLGAGITGITAGIAAAGATAGAGGIGAIAIAAVATAAVVSIGASYIAYKIRASNHINANEINAHSTGREIAAELRKEPIEVSVSEPTMGHATMSPVQFNAEATNDSRYHQADTKIDAANAELISRIAGDLEPLSQGR